jgi:hypothetical protein
LLEKEADNIEANTPKRIPATSSLGSPSVLLRVSVSSGTTMATNPNPAPSQRKTAAEERAGIKFDTRILNTNTLWEVMRNQPVRERRRYSTHFDIRGRVKAIHYDLAFTRRDEKFLLNNKQLKSVIRSD